MRIETLRLTHDECEGFAIRINGKTVFDYFTQYGAREDATLDRDHYDVLALGILLNTVYMEGVKTNGKGQVTLTRHGTKDREEYIDFAAGFDECDS